MRVAGIIHLDRLGSRVTSRMRWGFVPANAPDPMVGTKFIHARAETIEQKPTFREAFFHRRGIVPVRTFNEGEEVTPTKTRQHIISPRDGKPLGIAVVWERWSARNEAALLSFAMVTVAANQFIGRITDRMPAVIAPEHWARWLGEEPASVDELKSILEPMEADWDMQPAGKPPPPPKPKKPSQQPDLF
jgi:putative SOS response-associated peptidase YedK